MISIRDISKNFDEFEALKSINLDIDHGEFFALLGPSGCGKTTLLRILSGFEQPNHGKVFIDNIDVTELKPFIRPTNMMFQSYALFPHLNVFKNISYGLEREGLSHLEIKNRVFEIIEKSNLSSLEERFPDELSGGQRQRVALARCLVKKPKVLLLDEPLTALDKNLKEKMKIELKDLQKQFNITFIIVTHDQDEALALADRVAVMNEGRIIQIGTPFEVYTYPNSYFIAQFIGKMNFVSFLKIESEKLYFLDSSYIKLPQNKILNASCVGIRPEDLFLEKNNQTNYDFKAVVKNIIYHGEFNEVLIKTNLSEKEILVTCGKNYNLTIDQEILIYCDQNSFRLY